MGQSTRSIYPDTTTGEWQVDRWWNKTRLRKRGFVSFEEAERWLIRRLEELRAVALHGSRPDRTFSEAAAYYLLKHESKASIVTETHMLQGVMPFIGQLLLPQVHDGTLAPFVAARLELGRAHKTINLALGVVRRILRLAAMVWRDEQGHTWLAQAPAHAAAAAAGAPGAHVVVRAEHRRA